MKNEYWNSEDDEEKNIIKKLENHGLSSDIAALIADQISSSSVELDNRPANNIIFIFADSDESVVTGIHVPGDALNGEDGPVLMRGSHDKSIIAAFSREFIAGRLRKMESFAEEEAGLTIESEELWLDELENLADMARIELIRNPPESWEQLLEGEH
jgi:hypothetical protein